MSVGVEEGTELDLSLMFDEEMPCEIDGHGSKDTFMRMIHDDGPGRWYMKSLCPGCKAVDVELVCAKFKLMLQGKMLDGECEYCGHVAHGDEAVVSWTQR